MASAAAVASSSKEALASGKPGKVANHRLKVQQAFQTALRDFGLVRRVLCVPARVFKYITQNNRRRNGIVITLANIVFEHFIF